MSTDDYGPESDSIRQLLSAFDPTPEQTARMANHVFEAFPVQPRSLMREWIELLRARPFVYGVSTLAAGVVLLVSHLPLPSANDILSSARPVKMNLASPPNEIEAGPVEARDGYDSSEASARAPQSPLPWQSAMDGLEPNRRDTSVCSPRCTAENCEVGRNDEGSG